MRQKLEVHLGKPLATVLIGAMLVLAMTGSAVAAMTIQEIWQGIKPKADARYLENTKVFAGDQVDVGPGTSQTIVRNCPDGWQALGGGLDAVDQSTTSLDVIFNGPMVDGDNLVAADPGQNPPATGWKVRVQNTSGVVTYSVVVGVICTR